MSSIGANALKDPYMKLSNLGRVNIILTPHADNPELMSVYVSAETRTEPVNGVTNKDETTDQLCMRLKGMLRALWNAEVKTVEVKKK